MAFADKGIPYHNRRLRLIAKAFLEAEQDGKCAICRTRCDLVVDHDHGTGAIRGLLCNQCNVALGMFKDHPSYLTRAISYLGWTGGPGIVVPHCEKCNRRLAEFVEGRWSVRCPRCKHQNRSCSDSLSVDGMLLSQDPA